MTFEFWFMLPVSVLVATVAMASGVEGATFFAPIFLLGLGLPVDVAIGTGLLTEVFGFASGVAAYMRRGLVDPRLASSLLTASVPAAVAGGLVVGVVRTDVLETILGVGLIAVALAFLRPHDGETRSLRTEVPSDGLGGRGERTITTKDGEEIRYTPCNRVEGWAVAGVGALFMGMISTGLGELNGYFLLKRCRVPSRVAIATGVVVVAVSALSAATIHLARFVHNGEGALDLVMSVAMFTIPGVVLGGQLGPVVATRVSQPALERALGILFLLVGAVLIGRVAL